MAREYYNNNLKGLLNGSGINNIPSLIIHSSNDSVVLANKCGQGPIEASSHVTDSDCIRLCANSSAKVLTVYDGDIIVSNNSQLSPGTYCSIGDRPECNSQTTIPMLTINSVVCRSRFPQLFGGTLGNDIVACSSSEFTNVNNVLWDYLHNEAVNPATILIDDADEKLTSGEYRFRCKFNGRDDKGNLYVESPLNRFIPWRNWCAENIYNAHDSVQTVFTSNDFQCECGDFDITRVKHMIDNNPKSQCAAYAYERSAITDIDQDIIKLKIPYKCFNMNSLITDIMKMPPCPPDKFSTLSSPLAQLDISYSHNRLAPHPLYEPDIASMSTINVDNLPFV